jgi:hypothetical protein
MRAYSSEDGGLHLLRLPPGSDIYEGVTGAARQLGIRAASVNVIGALRSLRYGYYDQEAHEYHELTHDGELEIASAIGNVSIREEDAFLHLHVVASKEDGSTIGGHLFGGEVFVAEVAFHVLGGEAPVRVHQEFAGLDLWPSE